MSRGITGKYVATNKGLEAYFGIRQSTFSNWSNLPSFPKPLDYPWVTTKLYDLREVEKWLKHRRNKMK